MDEKNEIKLVQKPVIKHRLEEIGKSVTERLESLNLENQVATIDTVKALKKLRTELNKESAEWKSQLKLVIDPAMSPITELKEKFKTEITEKYGNADELLKTKIATVEDQLKDEKEANLKAYFIELCQSVDVDFITYDKLNIEVNLSTSEKKYKEQINDFIEKVGNDIELIKTQEYEAEIMADYKVNLDVAKSIKDVKDRKQREKDEQERIKQERFDNRISKLFAIGMKQDDLSNGYYYNDDIYIDEEQIKSLENGEFSLKIVEFEQKIKAIERQNKPKEETTTSAKNAPVEPVKSEPLKAPKVEKKEEIKVAKFEARATLPKLRALAQYMKDNNITYKNI